MKKWCKSFVHNCVVHPMMQFLPAKYAEELHDRNANWAFGLPRYDEMRLEKPVESYEKISETIGDETGYLVGERVVEQWLKDIGVK